MSSNMLASIAGEFMSGNTTDVVDALTFIESPWGLNFKLYPIQRFIVKAFYGLELDNKNRTIDVPNAVNDKILYTFTEKELLDFLYNEGRTNTNETDGKNFGELVMVLGRRAGKSTLSSCISCYEIYKLIKRGDPSDYYKFPPETNISLTTVAPTDDQAGIIFEMIFNNVSNCPYLRDRPVNQTLSYFNLQTDADKLNRSKKKHASLTVLAGGCASNSLRGRNNILIIMDEMAFFIDNNGRFSGSEVYKALKPSTGSFKGDGKIICISSPYAKYGQFYDLYQNSFETPDNVLMFQMYSSMVNPTIDSDFLKTEKRRDKIAFITEFGGEFSDKVTTWIDDEDKFRLCVEDKKQRPIRGKPGIEYFMGIDLGLKNDGTSVAIAHKDDETSKIVVDYVDVWFSGSSDVWEYDRGIYTDCNKFAHQDVLSIANIVSEIEKLCKLFPIKSGWFDQYNGYALLEQLHEKGLKQFRMEAVTDNLNHQLYQLWRSLYGDQMFSIYDDEALLSEILSLEAEKKSKSKIIVRAPNKKGAHDDQADAIARAVWEIYKNKTPDSAKFSIGIGDGQVIHSGNQKTMSMARFRQQKAKMHGTVARRQPASLPRRKIR